MPPAVAIAAAKSVTPREAPLAGLLFKLRGLPAARDVPIFRQMLATGFVTAEETVALAAAEKTGPMSIRRRASQMKRSLRPASTR